MTSHHPRRRRLSRHELDELRDHWVAGRAQRNGRDRVRITVHMGTCGLASGAQAVHDTLTVEVLQSGSGDVAIRTSGCIGLCSEEPLVTVEVQGQEPIVYRQVTPEVIREVVRRHVRGGEVVLEHALMRGLAVNEEPPPASSRLAGVLPHVSEFPFFALQTSWVLRNRGLIDPDSIEDAIGRDAYQGAARALLDLEPDEIIAEIKESGLRGRGGGGFPTGIKWEFCARAHGPGRYVLCNADEGDPGAFMDRSVMEADPHAVLEGMIIAGRAIGAHRGHIYCRAEYPLAIQRLTRAIDQARELGLLGEDILGSGYDLELSLYQGAGAFVCGEETALMASIEGRRGTPRPRPPFPAVSGLWGAPTVLNNVETYACVPGILRDGAAAFAALGTQSSKGTKVFALTGKVRRVGLVEVEMGTPLGTIVHDIGGGVPEGKAFKAAQLGGPSGGCIPAEHLDTPTDYEAISAVGAIMGSGGLIVMDDDTCMPDMARYFMDFCQDESCGKCTPCRIGTRRMLQILERICAGQGQLSDIPLLEDLATTIKDASLCGLGQTAPNPVLSTLRFFRSEYEEHIRDRHCRAVVCSTLFRAPCQHACPVETDVPGYVALVAAGRLDDAYRLLLHTNPFPAVCARVCPHPCQAKCRRAQLDEALAIRHLKRYVTDRGQPPPAEPPRWTRPERVAVVGAGPSGLTAARELRRRGYAVRVLEAAPEAGGMLRYGIPSYRLPRKILEHEIGQILASGVELHTGVRVGHDLSLAALQDQYEAVYLAVGAAASARLGLAGEDANGVIGALEFLRDHHRGRKVRPGRRVTVIGGGNAAVDAARVALRLGAGEVTICYRRTREEMPAYEGEVRAALDEGVQLQEQVAPIGLRITKAGRVSAVELQRTEPGPFDRSGRRRPVPVEGSEFVWRTSTVLVATGQVADLSVLEGLAPEGVAAGRVVTEPDGRVAGLGIWAGGDVVTGPATVIEAIRAGRAAARAIDGWIRRRRGEAPWVEPPFDIEIPYEPEEEPEERPQQPMPELDPVRRALGFREVERGYTPAMAQQEARRCLRCDGEAR